MARTPRSPVALGRLAWLVVVGLAVLAAIRLTGLDDRRARLFALQALTPVLYLPAYVVLVGAAVARRVVLATAALALVVLHVGLVWGDMPWPRHDQPAADGPRVSLLAVNVRARNPTPDALAERLARTPVDVLVVEELTTDLVETLRRSGALDGLPHRVEDPRDDDFFGSGIFSRFPIERGASVDIGGRAGTEATIRVGDESVRIVAVHTIQPLSDLDGLQRGLAALRRLATAEEGHLVLAGDFNATRQHRPFRRLLADTGLRDAHDTIGRGLARTWPMRSLLPPLALLDHVLVSDAIRVLGVDEVTVPGSDHRGVLAVLRLPG